MNLKIAFISESWVLLIIGLVLLLLIISCKSKNKTEVTKASLGKIETGIYLKRTFSAEKGNLNYRILYPKGFDRTKKYPLLLFLHGAGERGDDNEAQLTHGGELIKKGMNVHQSIAIFPQCPEENYWIDLLETEDRPDGIRDFEPDTKNPPSEAMAKVIELMKIFTERNYVDKSRIYVAGLSMGGMGTFDLCWRMPDMFAAAIAVCGAGAPVKAFKFSKLPIRIFHGEDDEIVSVEESLEMIAALEELGGNPEAFIYSDVNHNSWDNAFAESDFLSWLYKHEKK